MSPRRGMFKQAVNHDLALGPWRPHSLYETVNALR